MSTTVTDIFRPVAKESNTWTGMDIADIAEDVVEPAPGDANVTVAEAVEQIIIMGPPTAEGYSSVTRLEIKFLAGADFGDADLVVRPRIGTMWLDAVAVTLTDVLAWHTASFEVNSSRGALEELAVGMVQSGVALVVINVLYVTAQGPADFAGASDDLTLFDGTEAVRLVRGDGDETLIAHALRSAGTREEAAGSEGGYQRHDVAWHIPVNEVESAPRVGERLIDDVSDHWTILTVERQTLGTRYRCRARMLAINDDLKHRVDVQRAVWTKDIHGAQMAHWFDWQRGMRALVQPIVATAVKQRDQRTTEATHQVFFAAPIELDHNTRIVHEAEVYRVLAVSQTDRIDVLMAADVVRVN